MSERLQPWSRSCSQPRASSLVSKFLPANSFVVQSAIRTPRLIQVDEVYHNLFGSKIFGQLILARRLVAQNHDFGGAEHAFEIGREHRSDVRNDFFDVLPIGSGQPAERYVLVPDLDFEAFAQQPLDQLHLRTLAQ